MATGLVSGSSDLYCRLKLYKQHGYKEASWASGITFRRCTKREISWSCGVSKCFQVQEHEFLNIGSGVSGLRSIQVVCTEGPDRVRELIDLGASFDHGEDGNMHLAREGGHSHHRIVHSADMTGMEIERALLKAVHENPNIFMSEHHFAGYSGLLRNLLSWGGHPEF